jgi:hypothetical protein
VRTLIVLIVVLLLAGVAGAQKTVSFSIVGGSMGAGAAGDASIASRPGEIDRLVFLGGSPLNGYLYVSIGSGIACLCEEANWKGKSFDTLCRDVPPRRVALMAHDTSIR